VVHAAEENVGEMMMTFVRDLLSAVENDFSTDTWSKMAAGCTDLHRRVNEVSFKGSYPSQCRDAVSESGSSYYW